MKGSVALVSILIISAFTLILVIGMSEVNISTSYQQFNTSGNNRAYYAAEACLEEAIIRLENDSGFTTGEITFDIYTSCDINVAGNQIDISVDYLDFSQNYRALISITASGQVNNIELLNWNEI